MQSRNSRLLSGQGFGTLQAQILGRSQSSRKLPFLKHKEVADGANNSRCQFRNTPLYSPVMDQSPETKPKPEPDDLTIDSLNLKRDSRAAWRTSRALPRLDLTSP